MSRISNIVEDLKLAYELLKRANDTLNTEYSIWGGKIDRDDYEEVKGEIDSVEFKLEDIKDLFDDFKY